MDFGTIVVTNPEVVVQEKEVVVPELEKRYQDALTASSTEIHAAMEKAAQDAKNSIELEIKLQVNRNFQEELKAEEEQLEGSVSL